MGQNTRTGALDAQIVVDEVLRVLGNVPGFQGPRHLWVAHLRSWPGKVAPVGERQIRAAAQSLISRAEWPTYEGRDLERELTRLYEAGWCNHAIIHMLDHNPDGTRVPPWNTGIDRQKTGLVRYIRRRLKAWSTTEQTSDADTDQSIPAPAAPTVSFAEWALRMHEVYGEILCAARDERTAAHQAKAADVTAPRRRALPTDRVRQRGDRMANAMELVTALLWQDAREHGRAQTVPAWVRHDSNDFLPAGNELALLRDEHVHKALREWIRAPERNRSHSQALRAAVTRARRAGLADRPISYPELAELGSTIRGVDGRPASYSTLHLLLERAR